MSQRKPGNRRPRPRSKDPQPDPPRPTSTALSPGVRSNSPPPLHELPESEFEELCRDVMSREPTVSTARLFRTRGHAQFGIDIFCPRRHDDECEVAQCKREQAFGRAKIRAASDAFFDHLTYWQDRGVKRFVLIVTQPLQDLGQYEQIGIETRRFADAGIRYEAWSIHTLVQRMVPWPDIVARSFGHHRAHWVEAICGRTLIPYVEPSPAKRKSIVGDAAADAQFTELIALAAAGVASKLVDIRSLARRGLISEAIEKLATLQRESAVWEQLPPELRARALRLRASLALEHSQDVAEAKHLMAEADVIDRDPSLRLQAQIVLEEQRPFAALEFLDGSGQTDADLTRIAAVCHLRAGHPQAAVTCLEATTGSDADPETGRLLALALMALSRSDEAMRQIRLAVARDPDSWATRMTLGMLLYLSTLAPIAVRHRLASWPEPCDWAMVQRDDGAVARLREAAGVFAALQANGQERIRQETLQAWQLACLANDAARRSDAEKYCRDVLRSDPTHAPAILWALARAFPTEGASRVLAVPSTRRALEDLLDAGRGDLTHLTTLAAVLSWQGKSDKVARVIRKHDRLFAGSDAAEYRRALLAEAALRSHAEPQNGALQSLEPNRIAMLAALAEDDEAQARGRLIDLAERCHQEGATDAVLSDALFRLAYLGHVADVAPYVDWLLAEVGTSDAVRLAAHARAAVNDDAGALHILDTRSSVFPGGVLTRDLRLLRAQCHQRRGDLARAIAELQELNAEPVGIEEIVGLADLYVRRGDLSAASKTLSGIASDARLPAEHALRFAKLLSHDDPLLARILWDRAVAAELDARALPVALEVARRLAVGPESAFLAERLAAKAVPMGADTGGASVVSLSTEQLLEFLRNRHLEMQRFADLYARGEVPLHILAPQMGVSIAQLFHRDLALREERHSTVGFLPAVYGGRTPANVQPADALSWRLHMDVSAVLLAAHLGILDAVERCFRPVRISSYLIPTLLGMRDRVLDQSPEETDAALAIQEAVRAGRVQPMIPVSAEESGGEPEDALVRLAARERGAAVFWDEEARQRAWRGEAVINLCGLVAMLEGQAIMSPAAAAEARTRLGTAGREDPVQATLPEGAPLFFHGNTIQFLAQAGLLAVTCNTFRVHAEPTWLSHIDAEQRARAAHDELGLWIGALLGRLNRGLQDSTYQLLPDRPDDTDHGGPGGELLICLLDLFRIAPDPGNIVWVDDRTISAYASCGPATLVGVADILGALRACGRLGNRDYFEKLLRVRAANLRFLQAVEGEIDFWLREAAIENGQLQETSELAILRRYVASCLQDEPFLQLPPRPVEAPNPSGELGFVVSWQRSVSSALRALWADLSLPRERVLACSRWLRDSLSVERYERLPALQPTDEGRRVILAGEFSALLCGGFLLMRPFLKDDRRCRAYMEWMEAELLGPRLRADPNLRSLISQHLKAFLLSPARDEDDQGRRVRRVLNGSLLDMLPATLKQDLLLDRALLTDLGLNEDLRVVSFGKVSVPAQPYLEAVRRALAGTPQGLTGSDGELLTVSAALAEVGVRVEITGDRLHAVITDVLDILLLDDADLIHRTLEREPTWIDEPEAKVSARIEALLGMSDHVERVLSAIAIRDQSVPAFYARLAQQVADGHRISFEELEPPNLGSVLRHLRLEPREQTFERRLVHAAELLIQQYGVDEAFRRLSGLPCPLPQPLISAFHELGSSGRQAALARWSEGHPSPAARLHLARLARHDPARGSGGLGMSDNSQEIIVASKSGEFAAFMALLRAVGARSAEWRGANGLDTAERIAACWSHASRIYSILRHVADDMDELRNFGEQRSGDGMAALFSDDLGYRSDVACPQTATEEQLLVWGLRYATADSLHPAILSGIQPHLTPVLVHQSGEIPVPAAWLLQDRSLKSNLVQSFLADDIQAFANAVTGFDVGRWDGRELQHQLAAEALQPLILDGGRGNEWHLVAAVVGYAPLYSDLRTDFRRAIETLRKSNDISSDADFRLAVLRFACLQAALLRDEDIRTEVDAFFRAVAPPLLRAALSGGEADRRLQSILRAAIDLARIDGGEPDVGLVVEHITALWQSVPEATERLRQFVTHACYQLPFRQAERLWPLVLRLRAT